MARSLKSSNTNNPQAKGRQDRFRHDLKIKAGTAGGSVSVSDPVSGKTFSFTKKELYLCQAADAQSTTEEISTRYKAKFGDTITAQEVQAFHRRLSILGLMTDQPAPPEVKQVPPTPARSKAERKTLADKTLNKTGQPSKPAGQDKPRPGTRAAAIPTDSSAARDKAADRLGQAKAKRARAANKPEAATPAVVAPPAPAPVPASETTVARAQATTQVGRIRRDKAGSAAGKTQVTVPDPVGGTDDNTGPEPAENVQKISSDPAPISPPSAPSGRDTGHISQPSEVVSEQPVPQTPPKPSIDDNPTVKRARAKSGRKTKNIKRAPSGPASDPAAETRTDGGTAASSKGESEVKPGRQTKPEVVSDSPEKPRLSRAKAAAARHKADQLTRANPTNPDPPDPEVASKTAKTAGTETLSQDDHLGESPSTGKSKPPRKTPESPTAADKTQARDTQASLSDPSDSLDGLDGLLDDTDPDPFGSRRGGGMGQQGRMGGGTGGNRQRIMEMLAQGGRGGGMGGGMGGGDGPGGMMGAGMGRQGAGMQAPENQVGVRKSAASLGLFNPNGLFRLLYVLLYPLKYFTWLLLPAVLLACLTIFQRWPVYGSDLIQVLNGSLVITRLLLGALMVNLVSRLAQGITLVGVGAPVNELGLKLLFGLVPRFYVDISGIGALERKAQLKAYAAPLLARLGLFAFGTLIWVSFRDGGGMLPKIALLSSELGLVVFLITAFPLIPAEGMRWLGAFYGEPKIVEKTFIVVKSRLTGQPLPQGLQIIDGKALFFFGMAVLLVMVAMLVTFATLAASYLQLELGGLGVMLFFGLVAGFTMWLIAIQVAGSKRSAERARGGAGMGMRGQGGTGGDAGFMAEALQQPVTEPEEAGSEASQSSLMGKARVVWMMVGIGLLAVAFLPYAYEAGGPVEILPFDRSHAVARSQGQIIEILIAEGDIVTGGQVLARLSSWQQEADVSVAEILVQRETAELAQLRAGAKVEEIALSRSRVASARAEVSFARSESERAKQLYERDVVSVRELDRANSALETSLADLDVAQAQLELVESPATEEELLVAEAELRRLEYDLDYKRSELERTRILAPISGQIVTANLALTHGQYLARGSVFTEIENDHVVTAEIAVPEADIGLIKIGNTVRLKVYGQSGDTIPGTVTLLAPNAEARDYGRVVRVRANFPNAEGELRSAMTGYAKVEGPEMRVWQAFLRRIVRFYQVDVWSWVP